MNQKVFRIISIVLAFIIAMGAYIPGRATSNPALTPAQTVNIAYFYKPPNMDAASAARNFDTMILTNGDDSYRDQLRANGFTSTIPEYFRSEAIQDPGSCTAVPLNNQVAYKPGDFCFISQNHPDWFLLDARGRRLTVTDSGNYYRMDPGNAGWREFFVSRVVESQDQDGWTALFLDNVEASLGKFFGNNPARYPDDASYQAAVAGFLQYVDVNYSQRYSRPFFGNIIVLGSDDVWFRYLQYLDGALTERFAVNWDETSYLRPDKWEDDMELMERTQAQGKYAILVSPGYQNDLDRQNFAFGSYLLISNGKVAFRYAKFSNYREAWLYDNYNINLGNPLGPRYPSAGGWRRDFTNGCVFVDPVTHQASISTSNRTIADVFMGGTLMGGCPDSDGQIESISYSGVSGGPVVVTSNNGAKVVASMLELRRSDIAVDQWTGIAQVMGVPVGKLSDRYMFPRYTDQDPTKYEVISIANFETFDTNVTVKVGDSSYGPFAVAHGAFFIFRQPVTGGPVLVSSDNGARIIASLYQLKRAGTTGRWNGQSEMMGLPPTQLSDTSIMPYYDYTTPGLLPSINIANVDSIATDITVSIGTGFSRTYTAVAAGTSLPVSYSGVAGGPVVVKSSNGAKVIASMLELRRSDITRDQWTGIAQVMGVPVEQLSDKSMFPRYTNVDPTKYEVISIANFETFDTHVTVDIGNTSYGPFAVAHGAFYIFRQSVTGGPVTVSSNNGARIIASLYQLKRAGTTGRWNGQSEMMGLPPTQLSDTSIMPYYDYTTPGLLPSLNIATQ